MERSELKKTALGLLLVELALLVILGFAALAIALEVGLVSQKSQSGVVLYGALGASVLAIFGYALCLTSPREAGQKGWLFASLGLFTMVIAAALGQDTLIRTLLKGGNIGLALRLLVYYAVFIRVLELIALECFLAWLRSLALHLGSRKHAKWSLDLMQTGAAIAVIFLVVGGFALLREPPVLGPNEMDTVKDVLGLLFSGTLIGLLIWLISLTRLLHGIRELRAAKLGGTAE